MRQFLQKHGLWVLFAAAVIAVGLALMSVFSNTSSPLVNLAGILSSPFRSAYSAVAGWVSEQRNYFADNQALRDENQALRLAASQAKQNAFLIDALGEKCPQPAYVVNGPTPVTFPTNYRGGVNYASFGNGCGCGSF